MGNEQSMGSGAGDGVPFVCWRRRDANSSAPTSPAIPSRMVTNTSGPSNGAPSPQLQSMRSLGDTGTGSYHFAEPSSYKYNKVARVVTGYGIFTDPPQADSELRNKSALLGRIAIVERGGRLHFPDIVRRLLAAGVVGVIFIERTENNQAMQSLFDGFHSSGRQEVPIPIVLLSKFHADQLIADNPSRISIELLSGEQAIRHIVLDDIYFGVPTAARAGEVELLKHLLYLDPSGSVLERIPKAVALCDAAEHDHVDCIEVMHGFGISLNEQKPNGTSPLMTACSVGNVEVARALLMFGANLDLEDVHGLTALMVAARDGKLSCLKLLIRKGASINLSRNRTRGTTALHLAARQGHEDCCSALIEGGAALDTQSPNSTTALMEAARAGNLGCVKILANAGARIDAKDREGLTAEHLARLAGHTEIEDYLRELSESESVKDHRRKIEETVARRDSTLADLLNLAKDNSISVDVLKREIIRDPRSSAWLEQPRIIYEVFRLLTLPVPPAGSVDTPDDPNYGKYKIQHFCCEVALWYSQNIFRKNYRPGGVGWSMSASEELDIEKSSGYFKVLFKFVCTSDPLEDVLLIMFCKVLNHFIMELQLGGLLWKFFANEGQFIIPWLVVHVGLDSIRDTLVWLLYADMSEEGQQNVLASGIFDSFFARLYSWQRTLSWGVGTAYQRDSVENICSVMNYIIYPPSVYVMGNVATFVENTDNTLPLITDQHFPHHHNELFKSLLIFLLNSSDISFGTLIDLGFSEIYRQSTQDNSSLVIHEGGALSIMMMLMSTLGYHKRRRDLTGIESLLKAAHSSLLVALIPKVEKFVKICRAVVMADAPALGGLMNGHDNITTIKSKGSALLYIVTFLKRCVFLQSGKIDDLLAHYGLMPCFLACYGSHPNNSLLHHELTDVIRFVLMDPDQKRLPSCPLLNSLFVEGANILDFVMQSYNSHVQYKGHMTTIANSIFTLTNTPNCRSGAVAITCQEIVRQYSVANEAWVKFEATLAEQNLLETRPLGERVAPLCNGCLRLKEHAVEYVTEMLSNGEVEYTGYLETIFSGTASHYCKVNYTDDFITGFMYKKDKIHDHIPIPEPTRVSSFIQFPVSMPFHALTFTMTYFGLCQKCDKLWYCDTLQSANWANRMKWVIPTSVRKWYSFGVSEGPGSGAHGIQFSTKGYKSFIVVTDTWGRQEQWMRAIEEAIVSLATQTARRYNTANAIAIEIDNEVDANEFDLSQFQKQELSENDSSLAQVRSDRSNRKYRPSVSQEVSEIRKRSNTVSSSLAEMERLHREFSDDDDESSRSGSSTHKKRSSAKAAVGNTRAPTETSSTRHKLPTSPVKKTTGGGDRSRNLDLKKFQPDTKKFTEILNNLHMASPPRVNSQTQLSTQRRQQMAAPSAALNLGLGGLSRTRASAYNMTNYGEMLPASERSPQQQRMERNGSRNSALLEPPGMRHVVSTPDLRKM